MDDHEVDAEGLEVRAAVTLGEPTSTTINPGPARPCHQAAHWCTMVMSVILDGSLMHPRCRWIIAIAAPIPCGGQNWDGDRDDHRDFALGHDANDKHKFAVAEEMLGELAKRGWLASHLVAREPAELAELALFKGDAPPLKDTRIADLLEFGRIMHAEMAALMTAARRGTPVRGADLYTTTYPCHECMRLIIGAGIADVVLVAEIAGHRRLDTVRRYSLPSQADKDAALEAVLIET